MQAIWKYELEITDIQSVNMPFGASILSVAEQCGRLCLWAIVDPANTPEPVTIAIVGIGNPVDVCGLAFIGTVVMNPYVWHVFRAVEWRQNEN